MQQVWEKEGAACTKAKRMKEVEAQILVGEFTKELRLYPINSKSSQNNSNQRKI